MDAFIEIIIRFKFLVIPLMILVIVSFIKKEWEIAFNLLGFMSGVIPVIYDISGGGSVSSEAVFFHGAALAFLSFSAGSLAKDIREEREWYGDINREVKEWYKSEKKKEL